MAQASTGRPSARSHSHHSTPNAVMCAILRRIVSHTPRPEFRSAWAESAKITPIRTSGGT
jgi:hypothetical protein